MGHKILIVEDNADNLKLISWLLEDEGYAWVSAMTAEEGLQLLDQEAFDLILIQVRWENGANRIHLSAAARTASIKRFPSAKSPPPIALITEGLLYTGDTASTKGSLSG